MQKRSGRLSCGVPTEVLRDALRCVPPRTRPAFRRLNPRLSKTDRMVERKSTECTLDSNLRYGQRGTAEEMSAWPVVGAKMLAHLRRYALVIRLPIVVSLILCSRDDVFGIRLQTRSRLGEDESGVSPSSSTRNRSSAYKDPLCYPDVDSTTRE
jgi:hypothetical protein